MEKNRSDLKDKIRGCLLGVAIGDALGAPFEHILPEQSNQQLDEIGGRIENFHPYWRYPAGSWTDDTGMTLATCRAFIEMARTDKTLEECFKEAFEVWSTSQECRRPGKTVLYAAKFGEPDVNSWANGALMRISPVAIYSYLMELNIHETSELAYKVARLTHGHPMATFPAVSCVQALSSILYSEEKVRGFASSGSECGETALNDPASRMLFYTSEYEPKYKGPMEDLPATSGLWMWRHVVENCLGLKPERSSIVLQKDNTLYWSQLPEFESGILHTVNNSFDRNTAGAVAGAILGIYWGESGIPNRWREKVEKSGAIRELADELIEVCFHNKSVRSSDTLRNRNHYNLMPAPINLSIRDIPAIEIDGEIYVNAIPPETLKVQYEKEQGISPEAGWELLDGEDAYTLKRGDIVRCYIRPYLAREEILFREYRIRSSSYMKVHTYYRCRRRRSEVIDVYDSACINVRGIFDYAEVWIKRS